MVNKYFEGQVPEYKGQINDVDKEFEDFTKFQKSSQMLSFAGLEPATYQSGTQQTFGHMVKRGSSYLRETLIGGSVC